MSVNSIIGRVINYTALLVNLKTKHLAVIFNLHEKINTLIKINAKYKKLNINI